MAGGNHEEMLLRSLDDIDMLRRFLRFGGRETLLSYPVDRHVFDAATMKEVQLLLREAIPASDIAFIRRFEDWVHCGDYLFVHAGIEPGLPLEQQTHHHLRCIRHTIYDRPELAASRIGIDTGAYDTGRLTALGLEGTSRWLIETRVEDGTVSVSQRSIA